MLNKQQIKLVQMAVKGAGIRGKKCDGRYRLLLANYKQPDGRPVTSCKQLNNSQLEDLLAICEAHDWRMPGKPANFFRQKVATRGEYASFAQQSAIKHLAGDLGWNENNLAGFIKKQTDDEYKTIDNITSREAYGIIEALKAMFSRKAGRKYSTLKEIEQDMEVSHGTSKI